MPYNGSGTYSLPAGNPVVTGSTISSTTHNNTNSDIATALTNCVTRDGQSPATANIPMGGFLHTGAGDATARTHYAKVSQIQDGGYITLSSVSGADTITATVTPTITAYATGQYFQFVSAGANTGAVTLNISSLGAKAVTKEGTTALAAGDIASGAVVGVVYDGTRFQLVEGRSVQPLDATLTALAGVLTAANKIPYATALNTAGELDLSTNTSLGTSDTTLSSQKAIKTYVDAQVATAVADSDFTGANQSLATNGYQKFPGGLIVQWDTTSIPSTGASETFPVAFPNACLGIVFGLAGAGAAGTVPGYSATTTTATFSNSGADSTRSWFWVAIGY